MESVWGERCGWLFLFYSGSRTDESAWGGKWPSLFRNGSCYATTK